MQIGDGDFLYGGGKLRFAAVDGDFHKLCVDGSMCQLVFNHLSDMGDGILAMSEKGGPFLLCRQFLYGKGLGAFYQRKFVQSRPDVVRVSFVDIGKRMIVNV